MRTDIQVLRAVAVLGVMLAHFGGLMPGGFLGVDIFFAISGFVITLSFIRLSSTADSRRRILQAFWRRRFWRLFPALAVVLSATLGSAFLLMPEEDIWDHMEMTLWSYFFAGNIGVEVVSTGSYFDPGAETNWLTHLWSLGVEEQFYLLFPFVMLVFLRRQRSKASQGILVSAVAVGSLVSLLLSLANDIEFGLRESERITELTGFSALLGYYSPLTRAWQFGVGVLAALLYRRLPSRQNTVVVPMLGVIGLGLSLLLMPESNLFPGPLTVIPMAAMFVLLVYPIPHSFANATLLYPFRWLGDRSYSAYLWHWPVWSILNEILTEGLLLIVTAFVATLTLANVTYRYVERPLIERYRMIEGATRAPHGTMRAGRSSIGFLLLAPLLFIGLIFGSVSAFRQAGLIGEPASVPQISSSLDCIQTTCDGASIDVLLVGDSHAGALANALSSALIEEGISLKGAILTQADRGCFHLPSETISSIYDECVERSKRVRDLISNVRPETVIVFGYTAGRLTAINSGGIQEIAVIERDSGRRVPESEGPSAYRRALEETLALVEQSGGRLVVISGTPDFDIRPEDAGRSGQVASLAEKFLLGFAGVEFGQVTSLEKQTERHGPFRSVEHEVATKQNLLVIDSWETLCSRESCHQINERGDLLFSDQDHLSETGAKMLARSIVKAITG